MARQLPLLATGQIIPTALHVEMERSYLEYAMSVIVGRALPDVRDGLKPVHRRILYAMHELGLTPDRPFRKCARVVGDVLGKYHPHGDQAVYEALVRMVQEFSSRYPLLAGHGNFGSVDGDPPAAMRYTETRLAAIAQEAMLGNISEAIVDFTSNFDNSQQEPTVLPAQLPLLLLNGCAGIAVGMATNIPPHNLGEIVDGLIALIDNPQLADEKLWEIIPGPDFPTGGEIIDRAGIIEAYRHGRGIIPVRGVTKVEQLYRRGKRRHQRTALVITELPYQVNKSNWIEKIADLVGNGKLEGIADIRDESDRNGMRVVIELKRDGEPKTLLAELHKHTALQSNFGAILLALIDNKPCQLSLRELLVAFLNFREATLRRQYSHELEQGQRRLHLVEGLLAALRHLDTAIDILRNAPDGTAAKVSLQAALDLSEAQADSILAMPLRRLTGLERQKLQGESGELQARISQLQVLLSDRQTLLKALKKELRSLKRKFGDERRTRILRDGERGRRGEGETRGTRRTRETRRQGDKTAMASPPSPPSLPSPASLQLFTPQPPPTGAILEITHQGYISWRLREAEGEESKKRKNLEQDFPIYQAKISKPARLVTIAASGKAYPLSVQEVPPQGSLPVTLASLLPPSTQQREITLISNFFLPEGDDYSDLLLLTQQGRIKRLLGSELKDLTSRGLSLIKLKEGDCLSYACLGREGQEVALATTGGRVLRLPIDDQQLSVMGRSAQGDRALRLRYGEALAGCAVLERDSNLFLVSQGGWGKRLPVRTLRLAKLGDIGTHALQFVSQDDSLAGIVQAIPGEMVVLLTSNGRRISLPVESVALWGKDGTGDRVAKLKAGEVINSVIRL